MGSWIAYYYDLKVLDFTVITFLIKLNKNNVTFSMFVQKIRVFWSNKS